MLAVSGGGKDFVFSKKEYTRAVILVASQVIQFTLHGKLQISRLIKEIIFVENSASNGSSS
jgi:hypothetical protein